MLKRNTQERRNTICQMVAEQGQVSVDQLSHLFSTSEVTIRKDLKLLETEGLLIRNYGGAKCVPSLKTSSQQDVSNRKLEIAKKVIELIPDQSRLIIDSGQTAAAVIPLLENKQDLVVMTNSLHVASQLSELDNQPTLLMTGGTWDPHSHSFQGQVAEQVMRSYDFDYLLIGADGIDPERGTTTFNELLHLSQVMADVAHKVIVLAESSKIGRRMPNLELPWQKIHCLVTDSALTTADKQNITRLGVQVICA
ncbi:XRE family transcriptional regulator [Saccharobesus litoralis]|uniref:XRE family transcriptional regulator n=1 Tax=Saccharobesus litoralis TaxID=2172099 RepID=A0A2S0VQD9_9ALTE|nr:DeoR family transcriptional regulator [Saccharobesus litoralis]AWB66424.1 XRE family transcriptional regulator [Saccharobesus litoralis]